MSSGFLANLSRALAPVEGGWQRYMHESMVRHDLSAEHPFWVGRLPSPLHLEGHEFEGLWSLHPEDYHEIEIHGRRVRTPRWQQAYGKDYKYTGQVNRALPLATLTAVVPKVDAIFGWCKSTIDRRLNGLLLNWYDGKLEHYIGRHRDSTENMIAGAPIVTVSCGETRVFRLRPWKGQGLIDFEAADGAVFLMPYETNLAWTHEVPKRKGLRGRRISITLRAFR